MEQYYNRKILFIPHEGTYQYSSGIRLNRIYIHLKYVLICLVLLWLNFPLTATGQIRVGKTRQQSAALLLCHQWNISKTSNFSRAAFPIDSISSIRFLPNGYIFFDRSMQIQGTWNYDHDVKILYIIKDGSAWRYTVSALTDNELILEVYNIKRAGKLFLWRNYHP